MTLVAFHLEPDHVEIVTDSLATPPDHSYVVTTTKAQYLPHLDAAIAVTGVEALAKYVLWFALESCPSGDFDMFVATVARTLPAIWKTVEAEYAERDEVPSDSTLFVFGWSPAHDRYMGYELTGGGATPKEWAWKQIDVRICHPRWSRSDDSVDGAYSVRPFDEPLCLLDPDEAPASDDEWLAVAASKIDHQRTRPIAERVMLGGDIVHTLLVDRMVVQRRIGSLPPSVDAVQGRPGLRQVTAVE